MQRTTHAALFVLASALTALPLAGQSAQTLILPDVVDGGGWQSTIVLTNSTGAGVSASLIFHSDSTGGNTQAWTPPFLETSSLTGIVLGAGSSLFLHTRGTAAATTQGWAELDSDPGVMGYVIFTNRVPGHQDQDATAPAVAATNRILVPYDDASGFASAIAVVNPNPTAQTISVGFRTTTGGVAFDTLPPVPPNGHVTFLLAQKFPEIAGHEGLAEFSTTANISMIALRFNPTQSSTAMPVFFQSGAPIIVSDPIVNPPYDPSMYRAIRPPASGR